VGAWQDYILKNHGRRTFNSDPYYRFIQGVEYLKRDFYFRGIGIGFSQAVQRIELLSPDLIEELDERRSQGLQ